MKRNLFIAIEGIDGSGKSSQVKLLSEQLKQQGHKVYSTCEPTDGPAGSLIRNILKGRISASHMTIAGLFLADRLDHLTNEVNGIVKKLEEGYTVITDRYYFSSYAYHGAHMDMDWVIDANKMCARVLQPDVNIFIDVPPEICMERINANRDMTELYENLENLRNVRERYMTAFEKLEHTENIFITNGARPIHEIAADIWNALKDKE